MQPKYNGNNEAVVEAKKTAATNTQKANQGVKKQAEDQKAKEKKAKDEANAAMAKSQDMLQKAKDDADSMVQKSNAINNLKWSFPSKPESSYMVDS